MAQQLINNGTYANDPSAEEIYTAFGKVNSNETQLFAIPGQVQSGLYNYAPDTGVINAYAMTLNPTLTTYASGAIFTLGNISATNNGPSTLNINGVGIFPIHAAGGQALQGGELVAGHSAIFQVNSTATAFDLVQTLGGSLPVAPATQSNHAVNLGQAQTNFAAIGGNSSHTFAASAGTGPSNVPTLAQIQAGSINYAADSGVVNAYVVTLAPAPAALTPGMMVGIDNIVATNTGSATLNLNGLGALPIQSAGGVSLQGGELVASYGAIVRLNHAGNAWILIQTTGGPLPVPAGSQTEHATNLGQLEQVIGRNGQIILNGSTTLTAANAGQFITYSGSAAATITLPPSNASPAGLSPLILNNASNYNLTIAVPSGEVNGMGVSTLLPGQRAAVWNDGGSVWLELWNEAGSQSPVVIGNAVNSNHAVALGQVLQTSPVTNITGLSALGTNGSWTVTVSLTAPCAGYIYAFGGLNVASQAAAGIGVALQINGTSVSSDNTLLTQFHDGYTSVTSGEVITVTTAVTSGSTAPNVNCTMKVGVFFIPSP